MNSIVIENDGEYKEVEYPEVTPLEDMSKEDILNAIGTAGVVGMGGAGFPTRVKLSPKEPEKIEYVIANCAECEPYITADYRRMMENPEDLVEGMRVILKLFDNAKGYICIEDNKPDCIAKLKEIETMSEDGTFDVLPKKEVIALKKEWDKLEKNLGGIKDMKRIPDAIFIVDPKKERICVQEAQSLGITLIGIADTNCDPDELDYVIPGNDDAIRAVKLIVSKMADAVIEAKQGTEEVAAEAAEETVEE